MDRDDDDENVGPPPKRIKLDEPEQPDEPEPVPSVLPPSHALLGLEVHPKDQPLRLREIDVGISEYVGADVASINGIIKQRFTDFLVYEVDQDSNAIHIKSLAKPTSSPGTEASQIKPSSDDATLQLDNVVDDTTQDALQNGEKDAQSDEVKPDKASSTESSARPQELWPESFTTALEPFFTPESLTQLKQMFLEGPNPPRVSDNGWTGRAAIVEVASETPATPIFEEAPENPAESSNGKVSQRGKGRDRGGRGGGRGGRGGRGKGGNGREDMRKAVSNPISSKETRTSLHKTVKELFERKLETETDSNAPTSGEGSRIVVKWGRGVGRGASKGKQSAPRGTYPPYIHFTLQKTNRDTQDALGHLSRILHVNTNDLSVAGTKDKRGVTTQRVSLKRCGKTVEEVWSLANQTSGRNKRRTEEQAILQRGERGVRIADLNYRKAALELGMLKGNAFLITLRNVQVESTDTLHKAMDVMKRKGFINYYGMQRFGTADIPTHSIGLALLKSEWSRAVDLILQQRQGEHPDVVAAREAWLVHRDLDKALQLMPRRVVAERCILESFKKQGGETRNAMGALSTIPKNLRLMYIHAYQSYVWNAIVSERIRTFGTDKPVPGDLVFETSVPDPIQDSEEEDCEEKEGMSSRDRKRARKAQWTPPKVKTLGAEDIHQYSIFDVIVPLPGTDIAYPGGSLGEKYRQFLTMDGLDPDNFQRKQRDYTLKGSYRTLLHLPRELTYSILRYTDPDVALAQADEDKLLGFDPPSIVQDGKFMALQIQLTLGTAVYATMALREVTKMETSSHFQTKLTQESDDQNYKGSTLEKAGEEAGDVADEGMDVEGVEMVLE